MKVRILSGSQTGAVVEMSQPEAESAIGTGFGEPYVETPEPVVPPRLAQKLEDGNVAEAAEVVAKAKTAEQLDVLEKTEVEGKNRKGVLDAIEKRRAELKG